MYFLGMGLVLLICKWQEIGPVAAWDWWIVLTPFALAVAWWAWADSSGYTKAEEERKMEKRKQERIAKQREALGMPKSKR
ncbi:MAG: TIGR04438 family Trp-rich protein [Burkholderiaceae bacterium]|nr:TIGR04438 family Trp-rich protein [Burkholderiaceae bacterium]